MIQKSRSKVRVSFDDRGQRRQHGYPRREASMGTIVNLAAPWARARVGKNGTRGIGSEIDRQAFMDEKGPSLFSRSTLSSRRRVVMIVDRHTEELVLFFKTTKEKKRVMSEEVKMVCCQQRKNCPFHPLSCEHSSGICRVATIYIKATMIMPATPARATLLASRATPAFWGPLVAEGMGAPVLETPPVGLKAVELTAVPTR